jgi:hypothetical protein
MAEHIKRINGSPYQHDEARKKEWEWLVGGNDKISEDLTRWSPSHRVYEAHQIDYVRIATEILLENTRKDLIVSLGDKKLDKLSAQELYEEIDTTSIVPFTRFAMPINRRAIPRMFARSLFGFQPMTQPTGKIFYINIKYGTAKYPTAVGDRTDLNNKFNKSYGGARSYDTFTGDGTTTVFTLANYGAKSLRVFFDGVEQTSGFVFADGGTAASPGTVTFSPAPSNGVAILITYENVSEGDQARDINMDMESKDIKAESIKLRYVQSVETMQDFSAYHGLNSDAELTGALSLEVDREIDINLLIRALVGATAGNLNWDSNGYLAGDDNTFFRREYRKTLYEAIVAMNNLIFRQHYLDGTWIVGGVAAIERLEKLERFVTAGGSDPTTRTISRKYVGILDGKWEIYKDPRFPDNKLLMGFSGDTPYHQGGVFAPYNLGYMTDQIPDPNINFKMRKGIMSRFGFELVNPTCYSTLTIQ